MIDLQKVGGRKFLIALAAIFSTSLLMWFGKIADGIFSTVMLAAITTYTAGNVYQKLNTLNNKDSTNTKE